MLPNATHGSGKKSKSLIYKLIIYVAMTLFNNFLFKRKHGHAASTRCVYDARLLFQHFINKNKLYTCIYFLAAKASLSVVMYHVSLSVSFTN